MASFVVNSCIVFFSMLKLYLLPARGHHLPEHSRTKQAAGGGAPDELRPIGLLTVQLRWLRSRANSMPTPSASSTTPMHRLRSDEQLGSEKASHFPGWLKAIPHQDGLLWDSYIRHICLKQSTSKFALVLWDNMIKLRRKESWCGTLLGFLVCKHNCSFTLCYSSV